MTKFVSILFVMLLGIANLWAGPYGQMYTNSDRTVSVAAIDTWYEVNVAAPDFTAGQLGGGVAFSDHYLTVPEAGDYFVTFYASVYSGAASDAVAVTIMIDGTATETSHSHTVAKAVGSPSMTAGGTILSLVAGAEISIAVLNHSTTTDITIAHAQVVVVMLSVD